MTGAGNYERARTELSLVLCGNASLFEGYCQRAIAAARMGNVTRARQDLAIARQLDGNNEAWLSSVEKVIAQTQAVMPSETPTALLENLFAAARADGSIEQLAPLATKLVRAAHARRRHGIEVYQEKLRRLQWAVMIDPKNPARLAALGQYLFDEVDVRGEYVDPGRHFRYYRVQPRALQDAEIEAARDCFQRALAVQPLHVAALMGLAQIKYRENLFGDAGDYVRNALAVQSDDPAILDMMSRLMKVAASQALAQALQAAATYSWSEPLGNGWERQWTRYGDPAAAEAFGRSADGFLSRADDYTRRALSSLKDTPESLDYLGTRALTKKDFATMRKCYERAVQIAPEKIEFRYALANADASLGLFDKYLEQATAGRNLEHTSIGAQLLAAWQSILKADGNAASGFLAEASRIDPGDSRIPAYYGAIAEGRGDMREAAACFRAALAMEEAACKLRGSALGEGTPACLFSETSLVVLLRMRLARVVEEQDPAAALALYEKNLAMEPRLNAPEMIALSSHVEGRNRAETEQLRQRNLPMLQIVVNAMLPEPARTADQQKTPPNAVGLLQTSRSLAAVALYKLGRKQDAANAFRQSESYTNLLPRHGIGSAYLAITGIWSPRPIAEIRQACYRDAGSSFFPR